MMKQTYAIHFSFYGYSIGNKKFNFNHVIAKLLSNIDCLKCYFETNYYYYFSCAYSLLKLFMVMFIGMVTDCKIFRTVRLNTKPFFNFIFLIVRSGIVFGYFILYIISKQK